MFSPASPSSSSRYPEAVTLATPLLSAQSNQESSSTPGPNGESNGRDILVQPSTDGQESKAALGGEELEHFDQVATFTVATVAIAPSAPVSDASEPQSQLLGRIAQAYEDGVDDPLPRAHDAGRIPDG